MFLNKNMFIHVENDLKRSLYNMLIRAQRHPHNRSGVGSEGNQDAGATKAFYLALKKRSLASYDMKVPFGSWYK
jgi:hypothetical protein